MLAVTSEQLRNGVFMQGVKDCLRREIDHDLYDYPMVRGGRQRFSSRKIDDRTRAIVAEWPARREIGAHPPA
jgi:hypothetical protein